MSSSTILGRRETLLAGAGLAVAFQAGAAFAATLPVPIVVHRDAACGCCGAWVKYLAASGLFAPVERVETDMMAIKSMLGVPLNLASCHPARVGAYVIEGHVPVSDMLKLLRNKPAGVRGLSVPGMVPGSPGMEVPGVSAPYRVLAFDRAGAVRTFSLYPAAATRG